MRAGYAPPISYNAHDGAQGLGQRTYKNDLLVLKTSNALMASLETREWGRPVALQCAIVCEVYGVLFNYPLSLNFVI